MNAVVKEIDSLLDQCWEDMISDPTHALVYAQRALELTTVESDKYCKSLSFIGLCQIYQGKYEEASLVLHEALAIAVRDDQLENTRRINNSLGMCCHYLGRYAAAFDHYEFTVELSRKLDNEMAIVPPITNLATLLFDMGDVESADNLLNEILGLDFSEATKDNLVEVYLLQAQILLTQFRFADVELVLSEAENLATELGFTLGLLRSTTIRGRLLRLQGKLTEAEKIFTQLISDPKLVAIGTDGLLAYIEMAKTQFSLGHNDDAISMLLSGLEHLKPSDFSPQRLKVIDQLAHGYRVKGDLVNENACLLQAQAIERSNQARQGEDRLKLRKLTRKHDQYRTNQQLIDIENQMLKRSHERLSLLNDIAHQVAMTLDFSKLGHRLFPILKKHLDVHFISLMTLDESKQVLNFRFIIENDEAISGNDIPVDQQGSNSVLALNTKQPVLINDVLELDDVNVVGRTDIEPKSMLFMPLIQEDEVLGVFSMQSPVAARFLDYEIKLMIAISKFISIAVSNIISLEKVHQLNRILSAEKQSIENAQERIAHMAYHDSLTTLPNRQALEEFIERRIQEQQRPFHLVYIDLDGFKPVNDQYGHRVGDRVLIEVSRRISDALRQRDFASRVGGDEFVLIVDEFCNERDLNCFLNRLLSVIEQSIFVENLELSISASIGSAQYPGRGSDLDELMHNADSAMYQMKRQGRGGILTS